MVRLIYMSLGDKGLIYPFKHFDNPHNNKPTTSVCNQFSTNFMKSSSRRLVMVSEVLLSNQRELTKTSH